MKKNIFKRLAIAVLAIVPLAQLSAQESYLLKDLRVPQILEENPGYSIPYKFHIGFPCLSHIQVGVNSPINYGQYMTIENSLMKHIRNNNRLAFNLQENIIDFGFRIKNSNYISVTVGVKANGLVNLKKDFFRFLIEGNAPYEGQTLAFVNDKSVYLNAFMEFGIGFQREESAKFSWGVKAKYLLGLANAYTKSADLSLQSEMDFDAIIANYGFVANVHDLDQMLAIADTNNNTTDELIQLAKDAIENPSHGAAIDFGLRYRINKTFEIDASVTDLGFIHWTAGKQCSVTDNTMRYEGVPFEDTDMEAGEFLENFFDSLANTMQAELDTVSIGSYNKMISTNINIGGYIYASQNDRFGLNFKARIINGNFVPSGTISYHRTCGKWFDFTIGNTFKNNYLFNPGIGFALHLGAIQLYAMVDYINSVYIDRMRNVNAVIGINFFARRAKQRSFSNIRPSW
ncbi:MAG: hypothetical protein J6Y47_01700 [Bacteroidales bacterium]|nr:hypothetical protein [Bacteroidales bacterium]